MSALPGCRDISESPREGRGHRHGQGEGGDERRPWNQIGKGRREARVKRGRSLSHEDEGAGEGEGGLV